MKICRSSTTQSSFINSSRFYVTPNENYLLTTNLINFTPPSTNISSSSSSPSRLSSVSSNFPKLLIEIWNLKQELNKIHSFSFGSEDSKTRNFTTNNTSYDNKMNILFASTFSKSSSHFDFEMRQSSNYNYPNNLESDMYFFGSYFSLNSVGVGSVIKSFQL